MPGLLTSSGLAVTVPSPHRFAEKQLFFAQALVWYDERSGGGPRAVAAARGVRCRNLRRDTDIRFTLSLA